MEKLFDTPLPPVRDNWRPPYLGLLPDYLRKLHVRASDAVVYVTADDDARLRSAEGLRYTGGYSEVVFAVTKDPHLLIPRNPKFGLGDVLVTSLRFEGARRTLPEGAGMITKPQNGRDYQTEELQKPIRRLIVSRYPTLESAIKGMVETGSDNSPEGQIRYSGYQRTLRLKQEFDALQTKISLTPELNEQIIKKWLEKTTRAIAEVYKGEPHHPDAIKAKEVLTTFSLRDSTNRINSLIFKTQIESGKNANERRLKQVGRNQIKANKALGHLLKHRGLTRMNMLSLITQLQAVEQSQVLDGTTDVPASLMRETQRKIAGANQNLVSNLQVNPYLGPTREVTTQLDLLNEYGNMRNFLEPYSPNLNTQPTFRASLATGELGQAKQILAQAQKRLLKVYERYAQLSVAV